MVWEGYLVVLYCLVCCFASTNPFHLIIKNQMCLSLSVLSKLLPPRPIATPLSLSCLQVTPFLLSACRSGAELASP